MSDKWFDNRRPRGYGVDEVMASRRLAFRKTALRFAPIEQYTETLPRRWWQLKVATRIRIRRVRPQTINCRCSMGVSGENF